MPRVRVRCRRRLGRVQIRHRVGLVDGEAVDEEDVVGAKCRIIMSLKVEPGLGRVQQVPNGRVISGRELGPDVGTGPRYDGRRVRNAA